ncbi:hypothetical protein O3M35_011405 [Rhynocoris fuscipes]|uniref:Uncharacterized protein n=1 Tax=Rhynocoris fuscipes TaxID=488301 RepID=A0AAW1CWH1_9HEMI
MPTVPQSAWRIIRFSVSQWPNKRRGGLSGMVREDRVSAKGFGLRERAEWNMGYLAIATSVTYGVLRSV